MRVVVTTCTAEKRFDEGLLPAVERYVGSRIDFAVGEADRRGWPLYIFSGVYGLLAAEVGVPWYDHALQAHEVAAAALAMSEVLVEREIDAVYAIVMPVDTPGWAPYHAAIEAACRQAGAEFHVELWLESAATAAEE